MFADGLLINKLALIVNGLQTFAGAAVDSRSSMDVQGLCLETLGFGLFLQRLVLKCPESFLLVLFVMYQLKNRCIFANIRCQT